MTYEEFCEARAEFRKHLMRQSMDQSNRGCSVDGALQLYSMMYGHERKFTREEVRAGVRESMFRFMWESAYQQQRKRDAEQRKMMHSLLGNVLPGMIASIVNPRKLDQLLGDSA